MEDTPIYLETILEQAAKWTFAGDFKLLQWMKQISQDLENRGNKISEALAKLDNNVRSTNIALDNVANSLTTLQFGNQFVECRVQDDDDTHVNANESSMDNVKQPEITTTSKEILNIFLDNNLKVLRNCYEKYSIDLEDSDDEEISKEKTCIYQPINPYNDRPLPFIFGSKDWHSKWHVGLYENHQENNYSGDEISESFSQSSSTSHLDDNESFESNTEWASSNSVDNDHLNTNIEIKNASSLRGSQSLYPGNPIPITATKLTATIDESSSISTTSSSLAKKSLQSTKQNENLTQKSESINSNNSRNVSKTTAKASSHNKENTLQYKTQPQQFVDLFDEPPEDIKSTTSSSVSSATNQLCVTDDNQSIGTKRPPAFKTQPTRFVDLFAEPPEDTISSVSSNKNIKRKTVNLFDEDEEDEAKDDLITVLTKEKELNEAEKKENKTLPQEKSIAANKPLLVSKTSKSLFDDSDEDDDFLKAFVKKSSSKEVTKSPLTKTLLFDNEIHEPTMTSTFPKTNKDNANNASSIKTNSIEKHSSNKIHDIFDDNENNRDELLFIKTTKDGSNSPIQNPKIDNLSQPVKTSVSVKKLLDKPSAEENVKKSVNLFNEFDDVPKTFNSNPDKIPKNKNIFDDLDEEDDLFSTKMKSDIFQETSMKDVSEESSSRANKEKSFEILKDETAAEDVNFENKEYDKPKEVLTKDRISDQTMVSEMIENNEDNESLQVDNKLFGQDKLFEAPNFEKELNKSNPATITQNELASVPENITHKLSSSNKYEFNSVLFLDEPPEDDNAFFETLAKTPNTFNSNYNAIDLENDVYEPELPKVPAASTSNNQSDILEIVYTGLQLFSDIPPDDDAGGRAIPNIPSDANQTKRLHSVFYDDFNETLMALNQKHAEKEIPNHSVFSDEPPPMNQELNSTSADIIDHKVPDNNQNITYVDYKVESLGIATKMEETLCENTVPLTNNRSVSKLKMSDININVQALLPGAINTLRKATENKTMPNLINSGNDDIKNDLNNSKGSVHTNEETISKAQTSEVSRTAETTHILPNLTKNRVKASASRRPSTRRARQEGYRKSLIEEQQQTLESDNESSKIQNEKNTVFNQTSAIQVVVQEQKLKDTMNDKFSTNNLNNMTTSPISKLFEDKHEDIPDIFNVVVKANALKVNKDDYSIKEESPEYLKSSSLVQNIKSPTTCRIINKKKCDDDKEDAAKMKPEQKRSSLLFDGEEEDFDFLKHVETSKVVDTNTAAKAKERSESVFSNTALETYDTNALSSSALLEKNMNMFKEEVQVTPSVAKECEKQQSLKYNESLLNKFYVSAPSKSSNQVTITKLKSPFETGEGDEDDLFKTTLQLPTSSNKNKERNMKAKSQFKSFLDSESEEELTVAGLQSINSSTTVPYERMPNVPISMPKYTNVKLFADSESDSDDLFGNLSSIKTSRSSISTESTLKTQTKDQLGSKNTSKNNVPKTITQTNASLFSDLDSDEDDLFGGGAAQVKTTNATKTSSVKAPSTSKHTAPVAEISKSKTVDDNPLADLL